MKKECKKLMLVLAVFFVMVIMSGEVRATIYCENGQCCDDDECPISCWPENADFARTDSMADARVPYT